MTANDNKVAAIDNKKMRSNPGKDRQISFFEDGHSSPYCNNLVLTSKYSILSFVPLNLFQQFQRVANIYFLFIAILQFIPGLSPTHWSTTVAPLVVVLTVNAVKEGIDDYYRHKSDNEINNRVAKVYRSKCSAKSPFMEVKWSEVQCGDILHLKVGDECPADMLLLSSGHADNIAYVETANLDGETALKLKAPPKKGLADDAMGCKELTHSSYLTAEAPKADLYKFKGILEEKDGSASIPLDTSNLLLRGSVIKNTSWVRAAVVYAGKDTKIFMNMTDAPHKVSQLEHMMNYLVTSVFAFMGILCLVLGIVSNTALSNLRPHWYMPNKDEWPEFGPSAQNLIVQAIRFIILLNQFIPISLYVTLELVKVIQCYFLNMDRRMYHPGTDVRFQTRTTSLNEELGQIKYILSDKTGTLTQNVMEFVGCSILGQVFDGNDSPSDAGSDHHSSHASASGKTKGYHSICGSKKLRSAIHRVYGELTSSNKLTPQSVQVDMFMKVLALCNTVTVVEDELKDEMDVAEDMCLYMADSPDEEALVEGVAGLGYKLKGRTKAAAILDGPEGTEEFTQVALLAFSSERKRMSVIYRTSKGKIVLMTKGADQVMWPRISQADSNHVTSTKNHLREMGMSGYRTLVLAYKELSETEFNDWHSQYKKATLDMENRTLALQKVAESIERDLVLLGATAVEDKLQDGVPECISMLLEAGLHLWVLTGDKLETSLSIALSSMLLKDTMPVVIFRDDMLIDSDSEIANKKNNEIIESKLVEAIDYVDNELKLGLVIEGGALSVLLQPKYNKKLLSICKLCSSVICCRMSPLQKAEVTKLVKASGQVTLAIGDGANDVGMIQSAHVGVGISGREGRAAVLASDFAFAQFRFLSRLLLIHGRFSFLRNREAVLYAFYKNIAYCLPNVFLAIFSGVSSQPLYSAAYIATHNVCWTSLPTLANASLEQDLHPRTVFNNPRLYSVTANAGKRNFFGWTCYWLLSSVWHAVVIFFVPLLAYLGNDGSMQERGLWALGTMTYTGAVFAVNLKLAMRTRYWTWITHLFTWGSMIVYIFYLLYISTIFTTMDLFPELMGTSVLLTKPTFWLTLALTIVASLTLDLLVDTLHRQFMPNMQHFYQQLEYLGGQQSVSSLPSTPAQTPRQSRSNSLALSNDSRDSMPSLPSVIQVISS